MSERLGIGIIGTGNHGSRYARHLLADLPTAQLVAISRRSPQGRVQAAEWQADYHPDWRALVADPAVTAVIAATTPNLNLAIGEACAAAHKPLLLEKPLATTVAAGERLVALFRQYNLPLTVGQSLRFNPVIQALKRHLPQLGRLHSVMANHRLPPTHLPWLEEPEVAGGGVILQTAVHLFDALRYITGREVVRVHAQMAKRHTALLEDLFTAQLELSDGLLGTIDASKVGEARSGRYEFVGDHGQLQGDQIHGTLELITGTTVTPLEVAKPGPALLPLLKAWLAHLRGQAPNPIPAEAGLAALRLCAACRQSALEERWVEL